MEYRAFGRTGLTVPAVGMGTWRTFDVRGDGAERERRAIVDTALAAGMPLFDTSPMYGEAERVLARALQGRRDAAIVADKVWASTAREGRDQVRRALECYGGRVEIYQMHNLVAWREHLPMLEELQSQRAIDVVGATHYQHQAFGELLKVMESGRIGMIQVPYNAVDRAVERQVLPRAQTLGLGVLIMQPLGTGTLVRRSPPPRDLERLSRYGVTTWAQALLKWVLSDPRAHCVIPATSKIAHVLDNAAAGDPPWFDEDTRAYVASLAARL